MTGKYGEHHHCLHVFTCFFSYNKSIVIKCEYSSQICDQTVKSWDTRWKIKNRLGGV